MKLAETLALINAGYSKAEIAAMEAGEDGATETPEAQPAQEPNPAPAAAPAPAKPEPDNTELLAAIKALTATLQKSNIRTSAQPAGGPLDPAKEAQEKATEMLLNLCNT